MQKDWPVGNLLADRYEAIRLLGTGAMGEVWLAHDNLLGRPVAIKRILTTAGMVQDPHARERILREAKLAATIQHANVVAIHDLVHDAAGVPHVIMEYVEGESLGDRIRRTGPLAPADAARLMAGVCDALALAHQRGILHRDIKPANILVDGHGRAKLADFGIARTMQADSQLTAAGQFIGSVAYLAPEIALGHNATPASDVYSVGATLFHLVEGHPPFDRAADPAGDPNGASAGASTGAAPESTAAQLLRLVQTTAPPARRGGILTSVIAAMLDPDPARRPSAAQAAAWLADPATAARDLGDAAATRATTVPPTRPFDEAATMLRPTTAAGTPGPAPRGPSPHLATPSAPYASPSAPPPAGSRGGKTGLLAGLVAALVVALGATGFFLLKRTDQPTSAASPSSGAASTVVVSHTVTAPAPAPAPAAPTTPAMNATTTAASLTSPPNAGASGSIVTDSPGTACVQTAAPAGWGTYPAARCKMWQVASGLLTGATVTKGERLIVCQRNLAIPNPVYTPTQANTWWIWMQADTGTWDWFPETAVSQGATQAPVNGVALCAP